MQAVSDSRFQSRSRGRQPGDRRNRLGSHQRSASERRPHRPQFARSHRPHGRNAVHTNHRTVRDGAAEGGGTFGGAQGQNDTRDFANDEQRTTNDNRPTTNDQRPFPAAAAKIILTLCSKISRKNSSAPSSLSAGKPSSPKRTSPRR